MPGNSDKRFESESTTVKTDASGNQWQVSDFSVVVQTFDAATTTDGAGIYAFTSTGGTTLTISSDDIANARVIIVKDAGGDAGTNAITIDTEGSENIDGSASVTIGTSYGATRIFCDGSQAWTA